MAEHGLSGRGSAQPSLQSERNGTRRVRSSEVTAAASGLLSLVWRSSKSVVLQDCWAYAAEKRDRDGAMVLLMAALVESRRRMLPARRGTFLTANPPAAPPDVSKAEYRAKRTLETAAAALRRSGLVESGQDAGAVWWQLTR